MITEKELEAKHEASKKEALIPPCDNMEIILQAAFETGWSAGSGQMAIMLISAMVDRPRR